MNLNKIRVAGLSLLLAIMTSTNCFASSKAQEIKTLEFDKTIAIEDIEQYKSNAPGIFPGEFYTHTFNI